MHEHLSQTKTVEILTNSAKIAFGRIVNMFKRLGNMGYKTYETLIYSNAFSIANYWAGLWGYGEYSDSRVFQNFIIRYYLGTHRFTPLAAIYTEMDWRDNRHVHWIEMLRLKNRINEMPTGRWPRRMWQWDRNTKSNAWFNDIRAILKVVDRNNEHDLSNLVNLDAVANTLQFQARNKWLVEAQSKSKLETCVEIHDFDHIKLMIKENLSRSQHSVLTKFKAGILPIRFETGRCKGLDREDHICEICASQEVENEVHFLFGCSATKFVRQRHKIARESADAVEKGEDAIVL